MRNLTQYLKIGVGVDMVIKGSLDYYTNMVLRSSQNPDYGSIGLRHRFYNNWQRTSRLGNL